MCWIAGSLCVCVAIIQHAAIGCVTLLFGPRYQYFSRAKEKGEKEPDKQPCVEGGAGGVYIYI